MSVDLKDASIQAVREAIESKSNPTSWFLLHYPDPSSHSLLKLYASGPDPVLESFRTHLESSSEQVLFGYGAIESKGLVLVYLTESVGGVRRARAIVHSRAVASLFPDYSALVTISTPSDLTDTFVREKLGLNRPSRNPTHDYVTKGHQWEDHYGQEPIRRYPNGFSNEPAVSAEQAERSNEVSTPASASPAFDSPDQTTFTEPPVLQHAPALGSSQPSQEVQVPPSSHAAVVSTDSPTGIRKLPRPPTSAAPVLGAPLTGPPSHSPPADTTPVAPRTTFPTADPPSYQEQTPSSSLPSVPEDSTDPAQQPSATQSSSLNSTPIHLQQAHVHMSNSRAISSADLFPEPRARKPSFTSRISGALKSSPHSPKQPASPPIIGRTGSPNSPGTSRFKGSSLFGSFGRGKRESAGTPPHSPQIDDFGREDADSPPPPPPPKDEVRHPMVTDGAGLLGGEISAEINRGFVPPRDRVPYNPLSTSASTSGQTSLRPVVSHQDTAQGSLSPSPSARMVLAEAAQRRVAEENEVMEAFRRDQRFSNGQTSETRGADGAGEDDDDVRLAYDVSDHETEPLSASDVVPPKRNSATMPGGLSVFSTPAVESGQDVVGLGAPPLSQSSLHNGSDENARQREAIDSRARDLALEQEAREEARADQLRIEEDERNRIETERLASARAEEDARIRRYAEEAERLRIEREAQHLEEKTRRKAEEEERERRRLEEEQERQRQEDERIRLAEEDRERERLKAEEQARIEVEERGKEAERQRALAEERQRLEEAKRVRKESLRSALARGKAEGSVMLSGHVTAQTERSMIWRRRYFQLFPGEMRLFKAELDEKPIQIIHLGAASSVSQTYEESQIQGSFKVVSSGPNGEEEFFLFTDSPEDKDAVLEGLAMAKL
ncbi:hypothetical protein BCR39DRAFT_545188 [Naematelia encephala]|uniref:ADF-H domain-containing protein n=1 Tax=Naematelia encephala TaxID=71784 RepID=A0A1Y2AS76_9TREE|nr:hypothetical protein BCR39DRAFT_545188 [Naematelia encephala]